ncbi:unnamed protein product [Durusdinium trenchii]|uniref:Peptidase S54 rhomboid domain-containing protein n=1 Tax=Durusdinium trenchii TaxID=1381693 RepID=A0ABP0M7F0_9DINO
MVDPVWGEIVREKPSPGVKCCFACCPCCMVGCRTPEAQRAWRRFLLSVAFLLSVVQVLILIVTIILDGGFVSYEMNPMLGPHYHRLDAAGAKNAAKIARGEVWRLASATMLHAGWIHLVGNVLVQIRAGVARPASAVGQECPDGMLLLSMSITRGTDAIDTMEQKNAGTAQVLGLLPGEGANVVLYRSGRSEHMTVGCSSSPSTKPNET